MELSEALEYIKVLEVRIAELEARLVRYENPHTPPSQRRDAKPPSTGSGVPGQKPGHAGVTRPTPKPDETIEVNLDKCPRCKHALAKPISVESRIITDIPEPQPLHSIEYRLPHYRCSHCKAEVVASHPDCPADSRFGPRTIAHVTLLKYGDRLPHRKVCEALERQFNLKLSSATVLNITHRASKRTQAKYKHTINCVRRSKKIYIDETELKVSGRGHWLWTFTTQNQTLFAIRKSRRKDVLEEILGKHYKGVIVCDGLKAYTQYSDNIQRCWAHILREAKDHVKKYKTAGIVLERLKRLFSVIASVREKPPPLPERQSIYEKCVKEMDEIAGRCHCYKELRKLGVKLHNGLKHWFTCILRPDVEPTNNRAERALREMIVQRKIIGTLRNAKGTSIMETLMTLIATWKQQGLNPYNALVQTLTR